MRTRGRLVVLAAVGAAAAVGAGCSSSTGAGSTEAAGSTQSTSTSTSTTGAGGGGTATGTGGSSAAGGGGGAGQGDVCARLCDTKASLACPNDKLADCLSYCKNELAWAPWCDDGALVPYLDCLAGDAANYECRQDDGIAVPKDAACTTQRADMKSCMKSAPVGPFESTCAAWCAMAAQGIDSCSGLDQDCETKCVNSVADDKKCNSAVAMMLLCESTMSAADLACAPGGSLPAPTNQDVDAPCWFQANNLKECLGT